MSTTAAAAPAPLTPSYHRDPGVASPPASPVPVAAVTMAVLEIRDALPTAHGLAAAEEAARQQQQQADQQQQQQQQEDEEEEDEEKPPPPLRRTLWRRTLEATRANVATLQQTHELFVKVPGSPMPAMPAAWYPGEQRPALVDRAVASAAAQPFDRDDEDQSLQQQSQQQQQQQQAENLKRVRLFWAPNDDAAAAASAADDHLESSNGDLRRLVFTAETLAAYTDIDADAAAFGGGSRRPPPTCRSCDSQMSPLGDGRTMYCTTGHCGSGEPFTDGFCCDGNCGHACCRDCWLAK